MKRDNRGRGRDSGRGGRDSNRDRHGGDFSDKFRPRGTNFSGPKEMHKAVCADCGKECEVPFKPSGERPVYCRDCFAKHRPPRF